jgi:hypothetical protein
MPTIVPISGETRVNSTTAGEQSRAAAAALSDGSYVVVWEDSPTTDIFGQRFDAAGAKVGAEFRVNTTTANAQSDPTVTGVEGGGFAVAWTTVGDAAQPIFRDIASQLFDASGAKVGGEELNTGAPGPGPHILPSIAGLAVGGYVLVYTDQQLDVDDVDPDVYAQRYDAAGGKIGDPVLVHAPSPLMQRDAVVAGRTDGGFVVAWAVEDDSIPTGELFLQRFDAAGDKAGHAVEITDTASSPPFGERAMAGLGDGGHVVVWRDENLDIYAQRYLPGGGKAGAATLVDSTDHSTFAPSVAGLSDGGYVVMFASGDELLAQTFSASGARFGGQMTLASDVKFAEVGVEIGQYQPTLAPLADGGFVAVWHDQAGDILQRTVGPAVKGSTLSQALEIATGEKGGDVFDAAPNALAAGDQVLGFGGFDKIRLTAPGVADFTGVVLDSVEEILGSAGADTLVVDDTVLADVASINGRGGDDTLVTAAAALNLVGIDLTKIEHVTTGNAAGTHFAVDSVAEALLIDGAGAHDTVTATSLSFTARERGRLFDNGVEEIVDASGVYTSGLAGIAAISLFGDDPVLV